MGLQNSMQFVCYSMGRSQEQEEVSLEEGRKVGRKMEVRSARSSPRAFSPLLSSYPPPQVRIVHVGSDILTTCTASRRHCKREGSGRQDEAEEPSRWDPVLARKEPLALVLSREVTEGV